MSSTDPLIPDQPLRFGEMLTATYRYMRRNPAATLGVGALLGTVTSAVQGIVVNGIVFGSNRGDQIQRLLAGETLSTKEIQAAIDEVATMAPYLALAGVVQAIVQFAAMGVMTLGMVRALRGERLQPSELWREVPWTRILGINLALLGIMLVAVGVPLLGAIAIGGPAAIVLLAIAISLAFFITVVSTLAVPASIIDQLGVVESIRMAVSVSRGALLRTTGLIFGSILFWTLIGDFIGSPVGSIVGSLAGGSGSASGSALSAMVAGIVAGAITLPASSAMAVLVYIDRVRRMRPMSW